MDREHLFEIGGTSFLRTEFGAGVGQNLAKNSAGRKMRMSSKGVSSSRSASPETTQSALPARAASRNLSSLGSRQAVTLQLGITSSPRRRIRLMMAAMSSGSR